MIPVFQERFSLPPSDKEVPPHVAALLSHDPVHLLDRKGIYLEEAIAKLAKMVNESRSKSGTA